MYCDGLIIQYKFINILIWESLMRSMNSTFRVKLKFRGSGVQETEIKAFNIHNARKLAESQFGKENILQITPVSENDFQRNVNVSNSSSSNVSSGKTSRDSDEPNAGIFIIGIIIVGLVYAVYPLPISSFGDFLIFLMTVFFVIVIGAIILKKIRS